MPPKKMITGGEQAAESSDDAVAADCELPSDIIISILSRLPVKSIYRLKAVFRQWADLFATPRFIKLHYDQFSQNPANQNFMIYSMSGRPHPRHILSLLKIESDAKNLTDLVHPHSQYVPVMDFVGCISGLVCLSFPGLFLHLWNPALNLVKSPQFPELGLGSGGWESVGFGYDDVDHDFVVVWIKNDKKNAVAAVYTTATDSWFKATLTGGYQLLRILSTKCDTIVGGNPYWIAKYKEMCCIIWFDVKKMEFKLAVSRNMELANDDGKRPLMDWKGSLAVWSGQIGREGVGIWLFDVDTQMWNMAHHFGPFENNVERCLQCSKNGKIIGQFPDGNMFLLDFSTGKVKAIELEQGRLWPLTIFEYSESLVTVEGMTPVEVKRIEYNEEDEEGNDAAAAAAADDDDDDDDEEEEEAGGEEEGGDGEDDDDDDGDQD